MNRFVLYFSLFLTILVIVNWLLLSKAKEFGEFHWSSLVYIIPSNLPTYTIFIYYLFNVNAEPSNNVPIIIWILIMGIFFAHTLFFIYSIKTIKQEEYLFSLCSASIIYLTNLISIWMNYYILNINAKITSDRVAQSLLFPQLPQLPQLPN